MDARSPIAVVDTSNRPISFCLVKFVAKLKHGTLQKILWFTFSLIAMLPDASAKLRRTDLPDNGLRFLSEDHPRIYPTSLPLPISTIDEQGGNSKALVVNLTLLMVFLSTSTISLLVLSWKRRREDEQLFETAWEKHQPRRTVEKWTAGSPSMFVDQGGAGQEWISVSIDQPGATNGVTNEESIEDELCAPKVYSENSEMVQKTKFQRFFNLTPSQPRQASSFSVPPVASPSPAPVEIEKPSLSSSAPENETVFLNFLTQQYSPPPKVETHDEDMADVPIPKGRKKKLDSILVYSKKRSQAANAIDG